MANDDARSARGPSSGGSLRTGAALQPGRELEACIRGQLEEGANVCEPSGKTEEIVGVLAKAEFVKARMAQCATLAEAMRELGRRTRAVQQQGES